MNYKKLNTPSNQQSADMALLIARANAQRDHSSLPNKASSDQISDLKHRLDKPNIHGSISRSTKKGLLVLH